MMYEQLMLELQAERRMRRLQTWLLLMVMAVCVVTLGPWGATLIDRPPVAVAPRVVTPRGDLSAGEKAQIQIFDNVAPSVVYITTSVFQRDFFMNVSKVPQGTGTGFLWDAAGHVVTNYHVVQGANEVQVGLQDGTSQTATVVGVAPEKDVAVLQIQPPSDLAPVTLGTSEDLHVGQKVLAIGNPFGLDHTMTAGIVSALGREIQAENGRTIEGVIQTDAAINPGNSGGPLLDSAGRLIGMNTAIISPSGQSAGIGFAVPVDTVKRVAQQLITKGHLVRPTLGVRLAAEHVSQQLGIDGILVASVVPGSGAAAAGLHGTYRQGRRWVLGDVIMAVEGRPVHRLNDLLNELERHKPGDQVTLHISRDGKEQDVQVQLQDAGS